MPEQDEESERAARRRRSEILQVAGDVAGGMMATPLALQVFEGKTPIGDVAFVATRIALAIVDVVDQACAPVELKITEVTP